VTSTAVRPRWLLPTLAGYRRAWIGGLMKSGRAHATVEEALAAGSASEEERRHP